MGWSGSCRHSTLLVKRSTRRSGSSPPRWTISPQGRRASQSTVKGLLCALLSPDPGPPQGPPLPARRGRAWKLHDYKNWCRRVWHPAVKGGGLATEERKSSGATREGKNKPEGRSSGIPPHDPPQSYAPLQILAGVSLPELAGQRGPPPHKNR